MKIERAILIAFLGNYLINNVIAAIVALIPQSSTGVFTPQYIGFVVLSAITVAVLAWWYYMKAGMMATWIGGLIFGAVGFVTAIVTAFVSGICGVILQTGSLSQALSVLPNFWPFIWNPSTLVLLGYWLIPAAFVGWWLGGGLKSMSKQPEAPKPVF